MLKRTLGVLGLVVLCGLSLFLLSCATGVNRSSGLLYVLIQGANEISSYAVDLFTGNLSLINSNATTCNITSNTTTCGLPEDIILDPSEAHAFVLNQGLYTPPNTQTGTSESGIVPSIYGYTMNSDGSLSAPTDLTTGSTAPPKPSPCLTPQGVFVACDVAVALARDAAGKFLFVITGGNTAVAVPGSPCATSPTQGLAPLTVLCPQLYVFPAPTGPTSLSQLTPVTQTALTFVPTALSLVTVNSNTMLYITGSQDLSYNPSNNTLYHHDSTLHEYMVDASGKVSAEFTDPTTGFAYATAGDPTAVLALATTPIGGGGGVFIYVASATTNSVSTFQLCTVQTATCLAQDVSIFRLRPAGTPANAGSNPVAMVVDPTRNFLYVLAENSSQVFGFRINGALGTLTALSPANMSTGSQPVAIAIHSTGDFLFVSNNGSSNISSYTLDPFSGTMSSPITIVTFSTNPAGLVSR